MFPVTMRSRRYPAAAFLMMLGAIALAPMQARAGDGDSKDDYKPFDEVTKDFKLIDGFFPLYYNEKTDKLLAVIPRSMIGTNFLMARSISSGGRLTGYQFGHQLVRWEEFNKKLVLVEPELRHLRSKKSPLRDVIDRTYTDAVLLATPIVTERGKDPVIDLDSVLKKDPDGLGRFFGGNLDPSLSKWAKKKAFADNVELAVEAVFMNKGEGGAKAIVHYSISRLPDTDYEPREADDRIGYFLTARKDWATEYDQESIFKRYIHRWHLRKADPSEEVSDVHPDDQIVFYIEKTVPVKYRRYIREGILMWNKAFEKAGLRNAVQVRQQTDNNEFAEFDPEDVNYNFFRWIVSGRSFAMGPSRANPITGQILDADIIMDDSMVRVWTERYGRMVPQAPSAYEDPQLHAFYAAHPEWRFRGYEERLMPSLVDDVFGDTHWEPEAMRLLEKHQPHGLCTYASGVSHEIAMGSAFLDACPDPAARDDYVGQWIRLVACHEVGHTLGLRHNFKASSWKSLQEILANSDPEVPTTASVMDYNPGVYNIDRSNRNLYLSQCIGPYDALAIEYGYRVPGKDQKEQEMLNEVAGRVSEQGLDFATDEDSGYFAPDPLVNTYDYGQDPVVWAKYRMDLVDDLWKDMTEWAVSDGESYNRLRRTMDMFLFEYRRVTQFAARVVGGQSMHRDHKGDPNARPPIEILPVEKQREALAFLNQRVLSEKAFSFDPDLLNKLAPGRWRHWDSDSYDTIQEYPVHDRIASVQYWVLFHVTNPLTITRVYDAELKVPASEDALTVPELLGDVAKAVWSELDNTANGAAYSNRQPFITSLRRSLQREHLEMLTRIVLSRPGEMVPADAVAVARLTLRDLGERIALKTSMEGLDAFSRAHLTDAQARIEKALDAGYEL